MAAADSGIENKDPEDDAGYREETQEDWDYERVAEDVPGSGTSFSTEDAGTTRMYSSQASK
jgi:hypothetical protein